MATSPTTELEKDNLEAHVDLCALRYEQLDNRLGSLEKKVETFIPTYSKAMLVWLKYSLVQLAQLLQDYFQQLL